MPRRIEENDEPWECTDLNCSCHEAIENIEEVSEPEPEATFQEFGTFSTVDSIVENSYRQVTYRYNTLSSFNLSGNEGPFIMYRPTGEITLPTLDNAVGAVTDSNTPVLDEETKFLQLITSGKGTPLFFKYGNRGSTGNFGANFPQPLAGGFGDRYGQKVLLHQGSGWFLQYANRVENIRKADLGFLIQWLRRDSKGKQLLDFLRSYAVSNPFYTFYCKLRSPEVFHFSLPEHKSEALVGKTATGLIILCGKKIKYLNDEALLSFTQEEISTIIADLYPTLAKV